MPVTRKVRNKTNTKGAGVTVFETRGCDICGVKIKKPDTPARLGTVVGWCGVVHTSLERTFLQYMLNTS